MNILTSRIKEFRLNETISVFLILLIASLALQAPSVFLSYVPHADLVPFISYPWAANKTNNNVTNIYGEDFMTQEYIWLSYSRDLIHRGELPLWNPYIYAGAPFIANVQTIVFYPYSVFAYLLPLNSGIGLLLTANLVTAGFGMFLLLRKIFGLSLLASLFGSFSWMFSGPITGYLDYILYSWAWIPLVLFFLHKSITTMKTRYFLGLSLVLSSSILGGNPEGFIVTSVIYVPYLLFLIISEYKRKKLHLLIFKQIFFTISSSVLSIAISCIVLFPALEYAFSSYRSFLYSQYGGATISSAIPLPYLVTMLFPFLTTNLIFGYDLTPYLHYLPLLRTIGDYSGIIPLALIPIAVIFRRRDRRVLLFVIIITISLWLALSWNLNPFELCNDKKFSYTAICNYGRLWDLLTPAVFGIITLAAFSVDTLLSSSISHKKIKFILLTTFGAICTVTGFLISYIVTHANWKHQLTQNGLLPFENFPPLTFGIYLKYVSMEMVYSLVILLLAIIVLLELSKSISISKWKILQVLLLVLVLGNLMFYVIPLTSQSSPSLVYPQTEFTSFVSKIVGNNRIANLDNQLALNIPTYFRFQSVDGYDNYLPVTYGKLASQYKEFEGITGNGIPYIRGYQSPLFNLFGAKYFVTQPNVQILEGYHNEMEGTSSLASSEVIAELHSGTTISQSFVASQNDLTKINIGIATWDRHNHDYISASIREGSGPILYSYKLDTSKITHDFFLNFTFPSIVESQGKTFTVILSSNSTQGHGFGPWYSPTNENNNSQTIVNSTTYPGSLVYKTSYQVGATNFTLLYSGSEGKVYENNLAYPRSYMVYNVEYVPDEKKSIDMLNSPTFDSRHTLLLNKIPPTNNTINDTFNTVNITEYKETKVAIQVNTKSSGYLLLTDQFFPGWKAYVDGKESPIYQADVAFRAVAISSGNHTVTFVYEPLSFTLGMYITLISILGVIAMLIKSLMSERVSIKRTICPSG